ncbi:hypothetical protein AAJ76_1100074951 [Vairimorpha ceranae]|uniref:J domain-containing protein n=1 Tax=Vairimorpha ceranae TaxID=40302 RepID=A0A0F9WER9_9MICR|nr:hypothetical protein AAJ76_1100074951 [Vairimorpha ceranae]KAF5140358.1 hypothetical protein G9O61_00g014660 [Vairimorpha ceranae]KKO75846.1 hypothetical protein AAJ76_1100074951 [Vairimorpha ceranae]
MLQKFFPFKFPLTSFNRIMDKSEALKILDMRKGETIDKKYKILIKINHPDKKGSSYLTSKINEAYKMLKEI